MGVHLSACGTIQGQYILRLTNISTHEIAQNNLKFSTNEIALKHFFFIIDITQHC
jgi:hypothetical protein